MDSTTTKVKYEEKIAELHKKTIEKYYADEFITLDKDEYVTEVGIAIKKANLKGDLYLGWYRRDEGICWSKHHDRLVWVVLILGSHYVKLYNGAITLCDRKFNQILKGRNLYE